MSNYDKEDDSWIRYGMSSIKVCDQKENQYLIALENQDQENQLDEMTKSKIEIQAQNSPVF